MTEYERPRHVAACSTEPELTRSRISELEIEVSEGEVNASIAQMASMYRRRPEKLRDEMLDKHETLYRDCKRLDGIFFPAGTRIVF